MALPLIPVLALGFFVTWLVLYGMTHGLQTWLASLLNALAHPQGSFWKVAALKVAGALVGAAAYVFRAVGHAVSVAASHGTVRVAHYFGGLTLWLTHNAIVAGDFAESAALGFERLVAHTIPHEIALGTRPLWRQISRNRKYVLGLLLPEIVLGKWLLGQLRHNVLPRLGHLTHQTTVVLPRAIAREGARIDDLERALERPSARWIKRVWKRGWILVGAGLMVKFLVKKFPHLFCRNTTKGLKALCGMPSSLVDLLLGEALAVLVLTDICETVRAIELVADRFEPIIEGLVKAEDDFFDYCGHTLPSAVDRPGYGGDWLATTL